MKYAIRIPANESLERDIAELLTRSVGRPSHKPVLRYKGFLSARGQDGHVDSGVSGHIDSDVSGHIDLAESRKVREPDGRRSVNCIRGLLRDSISCTCPRRLV